MSLYYIEITGNSMTEAGAAMILIFHIQTSGDLRKEGVIGYGRKICT